MPRVTLTFDNGPTPETTPFVLDVLRDRGLRACCFVVGDRLAHPSARALLARAREDGHAVGNHSMHHTVPLGEDADADAVDREIVQTQRLLGDLAGPSLLFRPFGRGGRIGPHLLSGRALDHLRAERYTVVLWNSVPRDWEDPLGWADTARADIAAREHTVLVLHDLPTGAMDALPAFLDGLSRDGVDVTTDLPDDCVPMRDGVARADLGRLVGID